MGRKRSTSKSGVSQGSKSGPRPSNSKGKKLETYEDTLEEGGVDDFMFKRDQIMFNPQDESDEEDINASQGEDVLSLDSLKPKSKRSKAQIAQDEADQAEEEEDEDEDELPVPKQRKQKVKPDVSTKGRFGKPLVDSDDEEDEEDSGSGSGSGSDSEDEGGWGRQYYSRPSNRREKEEEGEYDEKREEERKMEVKEVRRLQRKARLGVSRAEDWGLEGLEEGFEGTVDIEAPAIDLEENKTTVPVPESSDPAVLLRHMEAHEPLKLALARDYPLVVHRLEKTARGIQKMMGEGQKDLHKGLGWLHYQTLLTYATTLAFYIHLSTLPTATRPDLSSHPILPRLLQLKEGVSMLEDLDFAAASDSEGDRIELYDGEEEDDEEDVEDDEELRELKKSKRELMARMQIAVNKRGGGDEDDEDEDEDEDIDMEGWAANDDDLWGMEGLEEGELEDLMADAENDDVEMDLVTEKAVKKGKKGKKATKAIDPPLDEVSLKKEDKKSKKRKPIVTTPTPSFATLTETAFIPSRTRSTKSTSQLDDIDALGDPTTLLEADSADKETRKRSLKFHTSRIAATSARRNAARAQRLGGDEDLPYRDRKAGRDAALRKNGPKGDGGEDLEDISPGGVVGKRDREVDDDFEGGGDANGDVEDDGYYDLVKRRKVEKQAEKEAAHDAAQEAHFAQFADDDAEGGPRALTRAIEKNRGLTPRRAKTGRNPRVKKRVAFEKAKRKVASQRAVFKGGQASLGGSYAGEKTGISTKAKSRKF